MVRYEISDLVGKTITRIEVSKDKCTMDIFCADGAQYRMLHVQDCCEGVWLEDIAGDLDDLLNTPILMAEESSRSICFGEIEAEGPDLRFSDLPEYPPNDAESETWTFYKMATIKGSVTLRWIGASNGYYSESVDFFRVSGEG